MLKDAQVAGASLTKSLNLRSAKSAFKIKDSLEGEEALELDTVQVVEQVEGFQIDALGKEGQKVVAQVAVVKREEVTLEVLKNVDLR